MNSNADSSQCFRKRRGLRVQRDLSIQSAKLREIRNTIQNGDAAEGLAAIEDMLVKERLSPPEQGKVLALAADSEFKRGAFEEAAEIQASAAELCAGDPLLWLRPRIGQIRALLKAAQIEAAWEIARITLAEAEQQWANFTAGARQVKTLIKKGKRIQVSPRPERISVVAGELGRLFLREGEIDAAKEFLNAAIAACPKGATRARESHAEIALREGDPEKALEWAMQALMIGKLQAKTLHTLKLLVQIKRQLGDATVGQEVLALVRTAQPSVQARATLVLAQELRAAGAEAQWHKLVHQWLPRNERRFPVEAAEMKKMILRDCKQNASDPRTSLEAARSVMEHPGLAPSEWLSAAKEVVRSSWWAGETPDLDGLVARAEQAHGKAFSQQVAHSIALSTMMAKKHDVAIPWLEAQRAQMRPGTTEWGKATWALARVESHFEHHSKSSTLYDQFARCEQNPLALRIQARLNWVRELVSSGDRDAIQIAKLEIEKVVPLVQDWEVLLHIARQCRMMPGAEGTKLVKVCFDRAFHITKEEISRSEHPSDAVRLLRKFALRSNCDVRNYAATIAVWEAISEDRRKWLWSEHHYFWEFLALLVIAYLEEGRLIEGLDLVERMGADSSSPTLGRVELLVSAGAWMMKTGRTERGLPMLREAINLGGGKARCKQAHSWLALVAWKSGDDHAAKKHSLAVREASGSGQGLREEFVLEAQAEWILAGGNESLLDRVRCAKFPQDILHEAQPSR